MARVKVSVVGLSYNGADIVPAFIDSIYQSSMPRDQIEVIICDNASTDGTQDIIRKKYPKVRLIAHKTNIGEGALNEAIGLAKGEYLFFTDCDMKFEKHCLENFYNKAKEMGKKAILSPTLYHYDEHKIMLPSYSTMSRSFYTVFVQPEFIDLKFKEIFMTAFIFLHMDTARKLKYIFDEDYFLYAEDFDLCLRIRLQGFALYTCPDAIMYSQPPSQTTRKYIVQAALTYSLEKNFLMTFFKISSIRTIIRCLPYVVLMRLFALLRELIILNPSMFVTRLKAYMWVPLHWGLVMKKRRQTQKDRVMEDSYVFKLADESYFLKSHLGLIKKYKYNAKYRPSDTKTLLSPEKILP